MINRLEIINFQSHENLTLDFVPGINIIVGKSGSGKTAILRAINLIAHNRPSGNGFIKHDSTESIVKLYMNKDIIIRKKGKNNQYIINDNKPLEAFGQDVPEEVQKILNFSILNYQQQLDAPFLLSKTSGEVSKFLNKIINLEIIDITQQNIKKIIRSFKLQIEIEEKQKEEIKNKIDGFNWIDNCENELIVLEQLQNEININELDIKNLNEIIYAIQNIENIKNKSISILEYKNKVDLLLDEYENIKKEQEDIEYLQTIIFKINQIEQDIEKYKVYDFKDINKINVFIERYIDIKKNDVYIDDLNGIIAVFEEVYEKIKDCNALLQEKKVSYNNMLLTLKVCPFCDQEIKHECE